MQRSNVKNRYGNNNKEKTVMAEVDKKVEVGMNRAGVMHAMGTALKHLVRFFSCIAKIGCAVNKEGKPPVTPTASLPMRGNLSALSPVKKSLPDIGVHDRSSSFRGNNEWMNDCRPR